MAKSNVKVVTTEEWEYEYANKEIAHWIPEDDERSASYKAKNDFATGRIRSRIVTTTTHKKIPKKPQLVEILTTDWVEKNQDML